MIIIEKTLDGERSYDLSSRLLEDRIIFLDTDVNSHSASVCMKALWLLNMKDSEEPISFYINSPGGEVYHGLGIIDTMNLIKAPVHTFVVGHAASMGFAIASNGEKGHRYATPNATLMAHQVSGGYRGNIQDAAVNYEHMKKLNEKLAGIIATNCGITIEQYNESTIRDNYMDPLEAVEYGVIDQVYYGDKKQGV